MSADHHDVLQLVFITEKLQTAMRSGLELTADEVRLVRDCAINLFEAIDARAPAVTHSNGTPE